MTDSQPVTRESLAAALREGLRNLADGAPEDAAILLRALSDAVLSWQSGHTVEGIAHEARSFLSKSEARESGGEP